ncbi:MAG: DEAD/DEAH box helicase, partial [Desulfovibrionaceae bacterium]|nr:DEAD/DEAH box helicase [Desulfovibrionaceae bacterium]
MPLWTLRPYQREAVDTLIRLAPAKQFLLLQAATGAGKTLMAAALMRHFTERWRFRCLFLAHKAILVRQALARMQTTFDDADVDVGCLCASVERPGQVSGYIVVASPQTLARRLDELPRVDLVVIDECHRLPPRGQSSLYADIIAAVTAKRPNARVVGITATPWRLGQGPIYGPGLKAGQEPWFDGLDVRISISELQVQGWLAPLTVLACDTAPDLLAMPVGASGDFREDALEEALLRPLHLGSAVKAVQAEARGRRRIAAFCVTIAHARALAARFCAEGIAAAAIDSRAGSEANALALEKFAAGELRVLCTVGMLTEGWDCPETDCLLMCRPTLSPALYVQMVGRGLRTAQGKKDCLLLDLSGNVLRHGSPNAPRQPRRGQEESEWGASGEGRREDALRRCPFCDAVLPPETGLNCPECEAGLFELTEEGRVFTRIDLERLERFTRRGEKIRRAREEAEASARAEEKAREQEAREQRARHRASLINEGQPVRVQLLSFTDPELYQVRNGPAAGAVTLKVDLLVHVPGFGRRSVQVILDPEGAM